VAPVFRFSLSNPLKKCGVSSAGQRDLGQAGLRDLQLVDVGCCGKNWKVKLFFNGIIGKKDLI